MSAAVLCPATWALLGFSDWWLTFWIKVRKMSRHKPGKNRVEPLRLRIETLSDLLRDAWRVSGG